MPTNRTAGFLDKQSLRLVLIILFELVVIIKWCWCQFLEQIVILIMCLHPVLIGLLIPLLLLRPVLLILPALVPVRAFVIPALLRMAILPVVLNLHRLRR